MLDEPMYVITPADREPQTTLDAYAEDRWIAGCERCRAYLLSACDFTPDIRFETDDYVAVQALVAAGIGVSVLPGLALRAHQHPGVRAGELPGARRRVSVAVYGKPPVPLPVQAFLEALV